MHALISLLVLFSLTSCIVFKPTKEIPCESIDRHTLKDILEHVTHPETPQVIRKSCE